MNLAQKDVLTTGEVAKICNVASRTVSQWFDTGQLKGYRIPGSKDRRIPVKDLIKFMKSYGIPMDGLMSGNTRVLIIDDEQDVVATLQQILKEQTNYEVRTAITAFAAGIEAERFRPHVILLDPPLRPRKGGKFEEIPHLMFYSEHPELSALCLFDPEGREWSNKLLIADTTMRWAAEWLMYYELWHFDGVWRGGGVGPENIAEARAAAVYRETGQLATDAAPPAAVARG